MWNITLTWELIVPELRKTNVFVSFSMTIVVNVSSAGGTVYRAHALHEGLIKTNTTH